MYTHRIYYKLPLLILFRLFFYNLKIYKIICYQSVNSVFNLILGPSYTYIIIYIPIHFLKRIYYYNL